MLEILLFVVALIGSIAAGLYDLKTTEIPDEIPYAMMAVGIVGNIIKSYLVWSYWPVLLSMIVGLAFLGFGFLMYYIGQWGGGDAKILSAIGFLVPVIPQQIKVTLMFPFPVGFFFNVFLVGAFYMIVYAVILSFINRDIWSVFVEDLKANAKIFMTFNLSLLAFLIFSVALLTKYYELLPLNDMMMFSVMIFLISMGFFILWKFVKTVEEVGFKKKIPISQLKVGDVPLDYKIWEGITEKELKKIKSSGKKYIWIKEGVRFAPAFPLALIFTVLVGDGIIWLFRFYI
jgi:prepilin signal peptidase PulO-like enzyme (type II secretory pathway)